MVDDKNHEDNNKKQEVKETPQIEQKENDDGKGPNNTQAERAAAVEPEKTKAKTSHERVEVKQETQSETSQEDVLAVGPAEEPTETPRWKNEEEEESARFDPYQGLSEYEEHDEKEEEPSPWQRRESKKKELSQSDVKKQKKKDVLQSHKKKASHEKKAKDVQQKTKKKNEPKAKPKELTGLLCEGWRS